MSENNSGAFVTQSDNRGNENKEKRQRFDPAKQDGRKNNYNRNRRRRNNGPRQGGYDNKKGENSEVQAETKGQNRERNFDRQNNRDKNNNKQFNKRDNRENREPRENREQNQSSEKRQQFNGERKPKNKRSRELDAEVAKNVKKVETIEDIRSDNARITKEIYLEIASLKNINLN